LSLLFIYGFIGLMSFGIDCEFLYGQGYDGASNMSGQFQGVQAHIRVKYPKAIYVHCAVHSLNLAVKYIFQLVSYSFTN